MSTWSRMWANKWARRALMAVMLLIMFLGVRAWQQRVLVQGTAPSLSASALSGDYLVLGVGRKPTLVYFWASWCGVCRLKEGSVESIARDHKVISVALTSGDDAEVRRYLAGRGLKLPVINDPDGKISNQWGVRATPTSFIVDARNRIRFREVGFSTEWGLRFRLWLAGL